MFYPSLEKVKAFAEDYNVIPVAMELNADLYTPISVFKMLQTNEFCFLLESVEGSKTMTRYSFIGRNPFIVFKSHGNKIHTKFFNKQEVIETGDPSVALESLCSKYKSPAIPNIPQFSGGSVGFFSYDAIRLKENLPNIPEDDLNLPDMHFMFVDELIAFDHIKQRIVIIVNLHKNDNIDLQYEKVVKRLIEIQNEILNTKIPIKKYTSDFRYTSKPISNMSKETFCANVEKAKDYILNGDIFQVVLSQRFSVETDADSFNIYRAIRKINPSPYMYYINFDGYQLAGASPEMLVRVENGIVQTSPIAGTRPRGKNFEEDESLRNELLADPKENAEHTMLVDLGRNDLGKVCEFGSVKVSRYKYIQNFSHVMHIVSDITGVIKEDKNAFDSLFAVLPAGTLSGAPKVRAMEIIDELETVKRCTYGGAICYISFSGCFDSCITIRTALLKDNKAYVQAGAGIVFDSIAENEYEETARKAQAIISAIERAGDFV